MTPSRWPSYLGGRSRSRAEFADLGDLVRGEDHQRFLTGGGLFACGLFALVVVGDVRVLGEGEHEARDRATEAGAEVRERGGGLLDGVVQ